MSQGKISISIGWYPINPQPQNPQLISKISAKVVFKKQQIKALTQDLCNKINKNKMPFILIQTSKNLKDFVPNKFKAYQSQNHHYLINDFEEDPQKKKFMKKIEKVFEQMNNLDNQMSLDISLYDFNTIFGRIVKDQIEPQLAITQRIKVQALLKTDKSVYKKFCQLARKVSPQFADSPIMAILPLFGSIQADIQMQSPNSLEEQNKKKLPNYPIKMDLKQIMQNQILNEEKLCLKNGINDKSSSNLYFSFGNLGIINIQLQTRYLVLFLLMI